jgi:hypothetical protein
VRTLVFFTALTFGLPAAAQLAVLNEARLPSYSPSRCLHRYRTLRTCAPPPSATAESTVLSFGPAVLFPNAGETNYRDARPYLAFFCRLELRIEEQTHFPVRFRLGEVRGWQQSLSKRE